MATLITIIRAVHIVVGITALLTFWVPIVVTKGGPVHRRVGSVYVVALYIAAATALVVTPLRLMTRPHDAWPFTLFLGFGGVIAFGTAYNGMRVLEERSRSAPSRTPTRYAVVAMIGASSLAMLTYSIANRFAVGIGLAPLGIALAVSQYRALRSTPTQKNWWLLTHIGSMLGSCMATVTAAVVNNGIRFFGGPAAWMWLLPIGTLLPILLVAKRRYAGSSLGPS